MSKWWVAATILLLVAVLAQQSKIREQRHQIREDVELLTTATELIQGCLSVQVPNAANPARSPHEVQYVP